VCCFTNRLTGRAILAPHAGQVEAHRLERFTLSQVEYRLKLHPEVVKVTREKVLGAQALPRGQPPELRDHGIPVKREIQGPEAFGRIPASASDSRPSCSEGIVPGRHVAQRSSLEGGRAESVDSVNEILYRQGLDEDAFRQSVDRPEHGTEVAALQ
jgi:hypothetical protein